MFPQKKFWGFSLQKWTRQAGRRKEIRQHQKRSNLLPVPVKVRKLATLRKGEVNSPETV